MNFYIGIKKAAGRAGQTALCRNQSLPINVCGSLGWEI